MIWLLFQPRGILTMTDETNVARPGLVPPAALGGAVAQPMTIRTADVGPVESVLTPAPRGSSTMGLVKIAGLGSLVQGVRDQISGLRTEIPALQESAAALRSTVSELKDQIDSAHNDIKFEAQTLGNGSGS